jgi:hypothetical protein
MLAQSLVEAGALASIASHVQVSAYSIQSWAAHSGPETWLGLGGLVLATLWLWNRRPSF